MVKKLIEHVCEDGIADPTTYCLTSSAKSNLLCELNLKTSDVRISDLRSPADITPKEMFYPAEVGKQVVELSSFLSQEKYGEIHERMQQQGFRQGFACLFYGGPGTGKTETVYQLARRTGRPIMTVDVPQIKSKWVGESEKNLKALFERYRGAVNRCEVAPILFFNEADAIIGKRKSGAEYAVDKMENTLQNILLQEMENLDGILIATTNLEGNLDSAFERRFLYKIKFETPDATVRAKIWQEMIKDLTEAEAGHLAKIFDFSGGQIENVARKYAISGILYGAGAKPRLEQLVDYCKSEQLASKTVAKSVGFHTA
jgi:SpoVK/Ycf46/Vps4 family AAA+-type ATPase